MASEIDTSNRDPNNLNAHLGVSTLKNSDHFPAETDAYFTFNKKEIRHTTIQKLKQHFRFSMSGITTCISTW